ncbi:MAG: hypothetical protein H6661_02635 [Ardenticatenaceae bacterium]|nr:hypothetical protein [Ardenticatenaceae bacterium]
MDITRPNYYQGQFLGAQDFNDELAYHRDMRRRHNLGPHTWGIVVGLELVEKPKESGTGVDVFLQPGTAVDGYGREIIVLHSTQLSPSDFLRFATDNHYDIWIAYDEAQTSRAASGYELCNTANQFDRLQESFRLFVKPAFPQPDGVIVDGALREPPSPTNTDDLTIPPDKSVPYQELPDDFRERWMLRLGSVRWDGTDFLAAAPGKLSEERVYVGGVTAVLLAPAAQLTIRDRATDPLTPTDDGVAVTLEGSLTGLRAITAKANLNVDGGLLDFRQADGSDAEQFSLERAEWVNGEELRVRIGTKTNGENRLVVGPQTSDTNFDLALAVLDNRNVGVRAGAPEHPLQVGDASEPVTLSLRGPDVNAEAAVLTFEDNGGASQRWFKLLYNTDANLLKITSAEVDPIFTAVRQTGRIGIGTDSPNRALTISSSEGTYLNVKANDGAFEVLLGADSNGGIVSTMTNHDLQLRAGGNSTKLVVKADGDIGIGTTNPHGKLNIVGGNDVNLTDDSGFLVLGDVNGENVAFDNNEIQARNNGGAATLFFQAEGGDVHLHSWRATSQQVMIKDSGNVGLGTTAPAEKLHVFGNIRLGSAGNLYAPGCLQNLRLIAGDVNSNGTIHSGAGFTAQRLGGAGSGDYRITFTDNFSSTPIVVASLVDSPADDNFLTIISVSANQFDLHSRDMSGSSVTAQDSRFTFIALGAP